MQLPDINDVFAHDSVEQIHQALEERGDAWAQQTLKLMHRCGGLHAMQCKAACQTLMLNHAKLTQAVGVSKCCWDRVPTT